MNRRHLSAFADFILAKLGKRPVKSLVMAALAGSVLAGCSGVIQGTEQVKVDTRPGGADCALERRGQVIARIDGTPGFTTIGKSRYDIAVRCTKSGYKDAYIDRRGTRGAVSGNMVRSRDAKQGRDTASMAAMGYDKYQLYDVIVSLTLVPIGAVAPTETPADAPVPVSVSPVAR